MGKRRMLDYELIIGLEIHIKLKSETKLFCSCRNEQDFISTKPNNHICPVCTAQPGSLPVIQENAVEKSLLLARALKCDLNNPSQFDRKSYFYPDLPAGYQITQFFKPYAVDGQVSFFSEDFEHESSVRIRESHMEVDTAKSIHDGDFVFLDFNRAGTPLVEVVTEPDFRSGDDVASFLKELQRIVKYSDIGDADMEKGQLRVDVNLSIRPVGQKELNERVELKNMNSFSAIKKAIEVEYERQSSILSQGGVVESQTRGRDESKQESFLMRSKESVLDYRYFPEPDLLPLMLSEKLLDNMREADLIVPHDFITSYKKDFGFHKEYINVLISSVEVHHYFHHLIKHGFDPKLVTKWLAGPIAAYLNTNYIDVDKLPFGLEMMEEFLGIMTKEDILDNQAKIVMSEMLKTGDSPRAIIKAKGFDQDAPDDSELISIIEKILSDNPEVVAEYKGGKETTLGFFVGQVMRATKGQADPQHSKALLVEELKKI